ncbi:putative ATP-dependent RNA helicase DHX57 [Gracilariopsis chorda]|uniref:Putative ATP-dependent RNA helicase DHX57 n=1 Tax=Gracilariopsis chorda TaxID=448386 RepID=A0A2V3IMI7_9FLOR|nr:putative ATP-dependent RNA helicase DHX57 [Gracilariopsis chorda]|eukprot:PXF43282.1 putative ATP-dependent RNA helicase DHX57 [Gracilariopsis chorda]
MFSNISDALDYLCLNLDESELPSSSAAKADVEIVQFYSKESSQGPKRVDTTQRDELCRYLCLSRYASERALKKADGVYENALYTLYESLTHNIFTRSPSLEKDLEAMEIQRIEEKETLLAIYGEDVEAGFGMFPAFPNKWSVIIRISDGFPAVGYLGSASVAFVNADGHYPFSAPVVLVLESGRMTDSETGTLAGAQKRLLMRGAAAKVAELRKSFDAIGNGESTVPKPVYCVYEVITFLCTATAEDLFRSATSKFVLRTEKSVSGIKERASQALPEGNDRTGRKEIARKRIHRPVQSDPLKHSPELLEMKKRRAGLPAHKARSEILSKVMNNQVVVVSGATGSGKTTQIPQFLLEEASENRRPVSIICTQPRRIAAMSVAERVASERCQSVGESVGYQVKLNSRLSRQTRLVFCTTGVLLRRLQSDPHLENVSHVILDEVHERSSETDFLMLILRDILPKRRSLRVILMSATLDAAKFAAYFSSTPSSSSSWKIRVPIAAIPGRTYPVDELYLEDAVSLARYTLKPGDRYARKRGPPSQRGKLAGEVAGVVRDYYARTSATEAAAADDPADDDIIGNDSGGDSSEIVPRFYLDVQHSRVPEVSNFHDYRAMASLIDESLVNFDLIDMLVRQIVLTTSSDDNSGAILVFLPGTSEISTLIRRLSTGPGSNKLWALPLHSLLSPEDQRKVFKPPPNGKRKLICSTNIAETSITINDVTVVIDTLRVKETSFDPLNGFSVLSECFVSKAAAKQRAGRAGRVSKGTCYRLVRRNTFQAKLAAQQKPEIQRIALEHLVLNVLSIVSESHRENSPYDFFSKAIDPPDKEAVATAINNLINIGALRTVGSKGKKGYGDVEMTALGKHLAGLPVDARIGKLLIYGSVFGCLDAALTIASTISERSPFYAPLDKREEARSAKGKFHWGKSDLLTYVNVYEKWRELQENGHSNGAQQKFCNEHFLLRKLLITIGDNRRKLANALKDIGFCGRQVDTRGWERTDQFNKNGRNHRILRAVICAALYPNIVRIDLPPTKYREVAGGSIPINHNSKDLKLRTKNSARVFLHPESTNFHIGNYETRWLAYYEKVHTSKLFIRDSTMVSPYAILLFGGDIGVNHKNGQMSVDRWVVFKAPAQVAVLARELRRELDQLLLRKFENTDLDISSDGSMVKDAIVRLITHES